MLIYLQVIDAPEDRDQFITLYETYRGLMFYVANQILQNEQDAEDAVHDAFLSVAEHIKKFSRLERHKTKAFLVTIVENKAIDLYRKKTHRKEEILWEETTGLAPAYEPEDGLTRCILKLPARYREFLRLKHELGYSTKEVAELMGISWPAARKLEQRARDRLEELCREEGFYDFRGPSAPGRPGRRRSAGPEPPRPGPMSSHLLPRLSEQNGGPPAQTKTRAGVPGPQGRGLLLPAGGNDFPVHQCPGTGGILWVVI